MSYQPAAPAPSKPRDVTAVAIGLIVAGVVNFASGGTWMAAGLSVLHDDVGTSALSGMSDSLAYIVVFAPAVLTVFAAPATVIGGVQMLRGRTRGLTLVGAIAATIPLTSCCFLAGMPFGIWALVVLRRPETKSWYAGTWTSPEAGYPGQQFPGQYPPQYGANPQDPYQRW
ncbi:MAG: hypothetical protein WCA46_17260 [Actinocatenispora sp.]